MFGGYGGYPTRPYQILGILTFVFAAVLFTIGMVFPVVYDSFGLPEDHPAMEFIREKTISAPTKSAKAVGGELNDEAVEETEKGHDDHIDEKKQEKDEEAAVAVAPAKGESDKEEYVDA